MSYFHEIWFIGRVDSKKIKTIIKNITAIEKDSVEFFLDPEKDSVGFCSSENIMTNTVKKLERAGFKIDSFNIEKEEEIYE